jgi:hypothetical protein
MKVELRKLESKHLFQLRSILTEETAIMSGIEWPFTKEVAQSFISSYNTWGIWINNGILVGKFKNRKATVTGFATDENNQPVLKTTKGDQKLFKPRIVKLMDK